MYFVYNTTPRLNFSFDTLKYRQSSNQKLLRHLSKRHRPLVGNIYIIYSIPFVVLAMINIRCVMTAIGTYPMMVYNSG